MARRAIPIIAFHRVESYNCNKLFIIILVSLIRVCVVYIVISYRELGQLMGVVCNTIRARALQSTEQQEERKKAACSLCRN